jgi:hypothetical protein
MVIRYLNDFLFSNWLTNLFYFRRDEEDKWKQTQTWTLRSFNFRKRKERTFQKQSNLNSLCDDHSTHFDCDDIQSQRCPSVPSNKYYFQQAPHKPRLHLQKRTRQKWTKGHNRSQLEDDMSGMLRFLWQSLVTFLTHYDTQYTRIHFIQRISYLDSIIMVFRDLVGCFFMICLDFIMANFWKRLSESPC